jgi:DNA polymerase-4
LNIDIRKIIHVDMDAFFASIEQRDNPDYRGKPVAVGGSSKRGVVAAASYEARKFGVRSALPSVTAQKLCPDLIFVKPRFEVYKEVSGQIRDIFHDYTDLVEPLSLDEAYLDVTKNKHGIRSAIKIAREVKRRIKEDTSLTASAGVSMNKFLAKIASDQDKPDGLFVILPDEAEAFVEKLPIEKFFGIGKVTAGKMHEMGIRTGLDLKKQEKETLIAHFGKVGNYYYDIARANDSRTVNPHRIRKSIGAERTFESDYLERDEIESAISHISEILIGRLAKSQSSGKTITLKVKFEDFEQITRSKTVPHYINSLEEIEILGKELMSKLFPLPKGIRLLGLTLSNLNSEDSWESHQLTLDF